KVKELLSLQQCLSSPPHHDEMLFIIIHQTYELWFCLILHECDSAIAAMNADDTIIAEQRLARVVEIQRILVQQIHILETMLPVDFLAFRNQLKPASGFQSAQFREIEFTSGLKDPRILLYFQDEPAAHTRLVRRLAMPTLGEAFYALLARRGWNVTVPPPRGETEKWQLWRDKTIVELLKIYTTPTAHYDVYRLAERLIEFDENLSLWRYHHVRMVERMIGFKQGTGGSEGVGYLMQTISMQSFPELWELRTRLELP
ncbi:MAG: tryptophan 2,3-dioxygenase family protein, partial [Acidobacteriota bacterium]